MKLADGGLVDIEFSAQYLQLIHAAGGGPLRQNTGEALAALVDGPLKSNSLLATLLGAWRLQQNLSQLLMVALPEDADPSDEPRALRSSADQVGRRTRFRQSEVSAHPARRAAHTAFLALVGG